MKSIRNTLLFGLIFINLTAFASDPKESGEHGEEEGFNPSEMIMHHVLDSHEWHLFDMGGHSYSIPLPVILYSSEKGLSVFLSSKFEHGHASYKGYAYEHGHIVAEDGSSFLDFSITKNAASLILTGLFMILVFTAVAKGFKKNEGKAPKGIQSFFEPIILYLRDDVIKPNVGPRYERYLPYLMTLFFFIWFGNIFGLLPNAANLTGNIAFTLTLAVFTLILTVFSGNKYYWGHIFWTPGVPLWLRPVMIIVELIGVISKPFALTIRLFVAITAGHIVILSLIGLTFMAENFFVGIGSVLIVTFITFIEILVAAIQAYVFTLFSALYIGMAVEEHH